jgi:plasmid stabilization system protein ParE
VEFLEALVYYEEQREGLGKLFAEDVRAAVLKIKQNPSSCPPHLHGTRRCRLDRFSYGLVYRTKGQDVVILAVMHLSRRPGYWKGRG